MTLTRHGHHIPGTIDTDEPEKRNRARCGGPSLCPECSRESLMSPNRKLPILVDGREEYLPIPVGWSIELAKKSAEKFQSDFLKAWKEKERPDVPKMQKEANASGSGELTKDILLDLLGDDIPGDAVLRINSGTDPREGGSYWSVRATWGEEKFTSGSGSKVTNFSGPNWDKTHVEIDDNGHPFGTQQGQFGDH